MFTTASTAVIRAWAQAEGLKVGDRGRLRPDVLEAYDAASGSSVKAMKTPAKTGSKPKASANTAAPKPRLRKAAAKPGPKPAAKAMSTANVAPAAETPTPKVGRVAENTQIAELRAALEALTARVTRLEATPIATKKSGRKG